jgi:phosphate-selective porin OprO/OprP
MKRIVWRVLALVVATHVSADELVEERIPDEMDRLREQIAVMQAQLDAQRLQLDRLEKSRLTAQDAPRLSMTSARPTIASLDGTSTLSLRSLVQADSAHYVQAPADPIATDFRRGSVGVNRESLAARDLSDGLYFRRARMGFEGVLHRDFGYRLMLELGGSGTEGPTRINDAWVSYLGLAPFTIQLGAGSPPANMDDGTTPEDSLFIERATPADLSRSLGGADGRTHVMVRGGGARWMGSLAFTGRTVNDAEAFDTQRALVTRWAGLLSTAPDYNLHVGVSGTEVLRPADLGVESVGIQRYGVRFRAQPELRVDSTRLIDTGPIDADGVRALGVELAGNFRNWMLQAERFWFDVERRDDALPDPSFGGWYVQGSWVLTGESRRYNMASGAYQNPRPAVTFTSEGGIGAWELALRFSQMDLDDRAGVAGLAVPAGGVRGGEQDIWTVGLNWYPNANLKVVLNYLDVDVDRLNPSPTAFGPSPASPPIGVEVGQSLDAYALRTQFSF